MQLAMSQSPVPTDYFDALTSDESEAAELEYQTNKTRQKQRVMQSLMRS